VLEAVVAVADEQLVISCDRSLNRLSGGWLVFSSAELRCGARNFSVIAIFLLLN